jgi:proline racemase/trans-L-3-hydroxyproline dehydratase
MAKFIQMITTFDTHTGGEPTRIVLSGLPPILGETMAAKKEYMKEHLDRFRTLLMREPRGHRDMFGAVLLPPLTDRSQYGILFMDGGGYLDMCGHGIIGITTALIEMGMILPVEPETLVAFDTPAGLVEATAKVEDNEVQEVSVANVPSFVYAKDVEIFLPQIGQITLDVSFGGNFFAMVKAKDLKVALHPDNRHELLQLGMQVKEAVNEKLTVQHPTIGQINKVELTEIYERPNPSEPFSRSVVIFGQGQLDRCPCGTGISATMATLYERGELPLETEFINESLIGTQFRGKLRSEVRVGSFTAVEPVLIGKAYLTGIHQFVIDPKDPLKYGFVIGR